MNRIFDMAAKQESLASAFRKAAARNLSIILVVDEQHRMGIVTLQNLMHSMALLAESRKLRRAALDSYKIPATILLVGTLPPLPYGRSFVIKDLE